MSCKKKKEMSKIKERKVTIVPFHMEAIEITDSGFVLKIWGNPKNSKNPDSSRVIVEIDIENWWYKYIVEALKKAAVQQYNKALDRLSIFKQ